MSGYAYAAIVAGALAALGVIYLLGRAIIEKIALGGKAAERADRAEADLALSEKQGAIMTRDEDREETAKSLDDGTF